MSTLVETETTMRTFMVEFLNGSYPLRISNNISAFQKLRDLKWVDAKALACDGESIVQNFEETIIVTWLDNPKVFKGAFNSNKLDA